MCSLFSLSGWRLCHWQLYKAYPHRWSWHHLLCSTATSWTWNWNPTRAIHGNSKDNQGKMLLTVKNCMVHFQLWGPDFAKPYRLVLSHLVNQVSMTGMDAVNAVNVYGFWKGNTSYWYHSNEDNIIWLGLAYLEVPQSSFFTSSQRCPF